MTKKKNEKRMAFQEFDPGPILKKFKWTTSRPREQHHMGYQLITLKSTKAIRRDSNDKDYKDVDTATQQAADNESNMCDKFKDGSLSRETSTSADQVERRHDEMEKPQDGEGHEAASHVC